MVAGLAGDWEAARNVHLELPETGVCSSNVPDVAAETSSGCCGTHPATVAEPTKRGLAAGVTGGLVSLPLMQAGRA